MDKSIKNKYTLVVGLEVHCQLTTQSKIYNTDENAFGGAPNTHVGVITLAHPGTLPMLNKAVIENAIKMGLACHSTISRYNIFDRKNYFYPDLPKGYQLTQDRTPICVGGYVTVNLKDGIERQIALNRIHVEEDAGKLLHLENEEDSLVDFNRAGVPLIEIVTEPDLRSSEEAGAMLIEIRKMVRYLGICDGNMEEGSMRCDANISVMLEGALHYGKKVEIKNMNSIRNVQRAIEYEMERQVMAIEQGERIVSETRLFDAGQGKTHSMRAKEELNDYRYFPDPDLSPVEVSDAWLNAIKSSMPALPRELYEKFIHTYGLPAYDAQVLTDVRETAQYFEEVCLHSPHYKAISNWVMGPIKSYLNEKSIRASEFPVSPEILAELIALIDKGTLSFTVASQQVFPALIERRGVNAFVVAQELNVLQDSSEHSLSPIIDEVLKEFPLKVEEFRKGKKALMGMFMGEVMKRSQGKADPKIASQLLAKKLKG